MEVEEVVEAMERERDRERETGRSGVCGGSKGKRKKGREKESAAPRQRKAFESDYHNRAS